MFVGHAFLQVHGSRISSNNSTPLSDGDFYRFFMNTHTDKCIILLMGDSSFIALWWVWLQLFHHNQRIEG